MSSFQDLIKSDKPVLVDFSAEWCGPCKMLAPILKQVKDQLADEVKIIKIDVDRNQQLAGAFSVRSVPTMILFKDGKQVWRQSGVLQAHELVDVVKQFG
ncbi:MAG: thioredoxin [Flavobacteriales bacterium]|nr:thioredoxin [Flavobacteriales bacterium]